MPPESRRLTFGLNQLPTTDVHRSGPRAFVSVIIAVTVVPLVVVVTPDGQHGAARLKGAGGSLKIGNTGAAPDDRHRRVAHSVETAHGA